MSGSTRATTSLRVRFFARDGAFPAAGIRQVRQKIHLRKSDGAGARGLRRAGEYLTRYGVYRLVGASMHSAHCELTHDAELESYGDADQVP